MKTFRQHSWLPIWVGIALTALLAVPATALDMPDPANPENPWDEIGRLHNEALDDAAGAFTEIHSGNGALALAMTQRLSDFASATTGSACPLGAARLDAVALMLSDGSDEIVGQQLGKRQQILFGELMRLADRLPEAPAETLEAMRGLESRMIEELGEDEAAPLLIAASVGRYSHHYWQEQVLMGEGSPWIEHNGGDALRIKKWLKADLKGALLGFLGSGNGLGALLGGAVASAIEVIDSL